MTYEKLIEAVMKGRSVNGTAKALGMPQKTFESYVKMTHFPNCSRTILIAKEAGVDIETAVKAVSKKELEVKTKSEKVKIALDKLSVSFKSLLQSANVVLTRGPATL